MWIDFTFTSRSYPKVDCIETHLLPSAALDAVLVLVFLEIFPQGEIRDGERSAGAPRLICKLKIVYVCSTFIVESARFFSAEMNGAGV
jgi:hypothetical protein